MDLREQLQKSLSGSYTIQRELPAGGMSRVFVAEETTLGRAVVIKVLPPELAAGVSTERFRREIALAAKLQHPHIVPLFASGEADGLPYFTMPFVEGESLRTRLVRGALPIGDAISILRDVARALEYAHSHGVVHRDIKPDNVLMSGHSATVTDFGVAKALSVSTNPGATLTELGMALGTPAYMSPEQASADPQVDNRTDIYAFGVLAYEVLTGRTPFAGRAPQLMLVAQVTEAPAPILQQRDAIPPILADLVMRCLAKQPADRPQSAADLLAALDAIATPSGGMQPTAARIAADNETARRGRTVRYVAAAVVAVAVIAGAAILLPMGGAETLDEKRVVVAPFANLTGDSTLNSIGLVAADWFTQGIATLPGFNVASSSSAVEAAIAGGSARGLDAVLSLGRTARAGTVIWGSYFLEGDSIRLKAEIVDVVDGKVRDSSEPASALRSSPMPAINMARQRIMGALATTQFALDMGARGRPPTYDAYREYAAGLERYFYLQYVPAAAHFQRAIELDSTFVGAYRYLALTYSSRNLMRAADSVTKILALRRASLSPLELELLSELEARVRGDRSDVLRIHRKMAGRDSSWPSLYRVGQSALWVNRPREALASLSKLPVADSLVWAAYFTYWGEALHYLGDHKQELAILRRGVATNPTSLTLRRDEASALALVGDLKGAQAVVDSFSAVWSTTLATSPASFLEDIVEELMAHGKPADAKQFIDAALKWFAGRPAAELDSRAGRRYAIARMLRHAGNLDSAAKILAPVARRDTTFALGGPALEFAQITALVGDTTVLATARAWLLKRVDEPYTYGTIDAALAQIAAVQGQKDEAVRLLNRGVNSGSRFVMEIHRDRALAHIRDFEPLKQFLRPKG